MRQSNRRFGGYTPRVARLEAISTTDAAGRAADLVVAAIDGAVTERGRFLMVLSGGSTPAPLYRLLAERPGIPWTRVHLFWGDERFVPVDHPDSNQRSAREELTDRIDIPEEQVHPWPILASPAASAAAYASLLAKVAGDPPAFDLALLGLGSDCHTASLFPGTGTHLAPGLTVASRPAAVAQDRLSLTASALGSSRTVLFLVTGREKREALTALLAESGDPAACPARAIGARERLLLLTDQPLMGA
jgi:6-phosphogluconolactonase